jgi:hypothetical protein
MGDFLKIHGLVHYDKRIINNMMVLTIRNRFPIHVDPLENRLRNLHFLNLTAYSLNTLEIMPSNWVQPFGIRVAPRCILGDMYASITLSTSACFHS